MVASGVGEPVVASWAGVNSTTELLPRLATHRSPARSKARPCGRSKLLVTAERVTAGVGAPFAASWAGVNSTSVPPSFATHRSPAEMNASPCGSSRLPARVEVRVTVGVGQPVASWDRVNSTTVLLLKFATHRLPEEPKAKPDGPSRLPAVDERVTAGVGEPVAASWAGVNSTTVLLLKFATHRLPEESKAARYGTSRLLRLPNALVGVVSPVTLARYDVTMLESSLET
jgi:hypothetical protein